MLYSRYRMAAPRGRRSRPVDGSAPKERPMSFEGTAFVNKEEGQYVARCPELGVSSRGESMLEVLAKLREDVRSYLQQQEGQGEVSPDDIHLSVMRVEVEL